MEMPVIHLFTHDSIGLGEDGPTHQPIEQLASLRAMPHLDVIRPADANEVTEAWKLAVGRTKGPVALILTRQNVPIFDRSKYASRRGRRRAAATCSPTARARPGADPDRDRLRGAAGARRPREAGRGRAPHARRQPPLLGAVRPPGRGLPRLGAARRRRLRGWRSRRARRWAGSATSAPTARSSRWRPSASRRNTPTSRPSSASRPSRFSKKPRRRLR